MCTFLSFQLCVDCIRAAPFWIVKRARKIAEEKRRILEQMSGGGPGKEAGKSFLPHLPQSLLLFSLCSNLAMPLIAHVLGFHLPSRLSRKGTASSLQLCTTCTFHTQAISSNFSFLLSSFKSPFVSLLPVCFLFPYSFLFFHPCFCSLYCLAWLSRGDVCFTFLSFSITH